MQRDPLVVAQRWVAQARADLGSARTAFDAKDFALVCFLSQQAAEKAIKGLLRWRAGDFARTHLIADLVREVAAVDGNLARRMQETVALDAFYLATRYPDAIDDGIPADSFFEREASLAFERASDAVDLIAGLLSADS